MRESWFVIRKQIRNRSLDARIWLKNVRGARERQGGQYVGPSSSHGRQWLILAHYIVLFYYLIKWKLINMLINYLIKNQIFF